MLIIIILPIFRVICEWNVFGQTFAIILLWRTYCHMIEQRRSRSWQRWTWARWRQARAPTCSACRGASRPGCGSCRRCARATRTTRPQSRCSRYSRRRTLSRPTACRPPLPAASQQARARPGPPRRCIRRRTSSRLKAYRPTPSAASQPARARAAAGADHTSPGATSTSGRPPSRRLFES